MRKIIISAISALLLILPAGCKKTATENELTVFVSILPQKYFVEKIAGDRVNVEVLVTPGKSPATYEPTPQQVTGLGNAEILFTIGVPFENAFLPKIKGTLKSLTIIDTSAGIEKRMLDAHSHDEDEHHEEGEHRGTPDPHIWLSPTLVKTQAKTIFDALVKMDPAGEADYQEGYDSFIKELDEVHAQLADTLKPYAGSTLFVFHPAFGYFADEFGLNQVAFETGGKEPTPAKLTEIIDDAREEGVKIIFVQPEFSQESAAKIAQSIGGTVVMLNPLHPDYINNLKSISTDVENAFK